ncbi:C40 family peptidase [Alteraurantiacibacter aquimixticola]|uniref:Peptidoglycan endopeptidase n=1 Tax=Alteraurantiacibacter aquimixticola TaxID=2489173 RepID=A0A4T3F1U4_9SPHN|nr:C40 family peptidase [Alteraurantiacibacter aquimixticola]TIX49375.1 peptidoglycan endopeptidase [Alteraurantiacibacter aquimixticola]
MSTPGEQFAAIAHSLLGTPFRLHGRSASSGVDCVGLVALTLHATGRTSRSPVGYTLRNLAADAYLPLLEANGFFPATDVPLTGDLVLARPGPGQFHLLIQSGCGGHIHAHAGLGRVVLTPPPLSWATLGRWRLAPD